MPDKTAVLILTSSFPRGPEDETCGYVAELSRRLGAHHLVTVLAPPDRDAEPWPADEFSLVRSFSPLPSTLDAFQASRDFNDELVRGPLSALGFAISFLCYLWTAFRLARRADVVVSHWLVPCGLAGALIALILRKPHVGIEHSGGLHLLARARGGKLLAAFIAAQSRKLVFVSHDLKDRFVRLVPSSSRKVEVIPMGVVVRHFNEVTSIPRIVSSPKAEAMGFFESAWDANPNVTPPKSDSDAQLFIGRLTEIKGIDLLLRASALLPQANLIIAGDGPLRSELESLASLLNVRATFLGRVDAGERNQLLLNCALVVIPSIVLSGGRTEGTPVVCLEALAAGRAVVASRAGGLAEIIKDGHNGLLFEPGDPWDLAEKLRLLLLDHDLRRRLAENGRATAAQFDWSSTSARLSAIIDAALTRNVSTNCDARIETRRARA